jgi:hypothetical protein
MNRFFTHVTSQTILSSICSLFLFSYATLQGGQAVSSMASSLDKSDAEANIERLLNLPAAPTQLQKSILKTYIWCAKNPGNLDAVLTNNDRLTSCLRWIIQNPIVSVAAASTVATAALLTIYKMIKTTIKVAAVVIPSTLIIQVSKQTKKLPFL